MSQSAKVETAGNAYDSDRATASRRDSGRGAAAIGRLALSPAEAAESIGVSRDFFDEHVLPELRAVRRGRRRLVPVRELERWLDRAAAIPLADEHGSRLP
jgi:excisionase family DNA binding protein